MKTVCCFLVILLSRQAICGIIRNPPAFSKPVYSDSYLPAAMQVIFHAVEQLKALQSEETTQNFTAIRNPSTSPMTLQNLQTTQQSSPVTPSTAAQPLNETNVEKQPPKNEMENSKLEESSEDKPEASSIDKIEESSINKIEESKIDEAPKDELKEPSKDKTEDSKIEEISKNKPEESKPEESSINKIEESKIDEAPKDELKEQSKDKTEDSKIEEISKNKPEESKPKESSTDKVEESKINETPKDELKEPSKDKTEDSKIAEISTSKPEESKLEESSMDEAEESKTDETPKHKLVESKTGETSKDKVESSKIDEVSRDKMEDSTLEETSRPVEIDQESMEEPSRNQESPEVNEETPETNYATPETNYEEPEVVHAVQETNQEVPEENHEWISSTHTAAETKLEATTASGNPADSSTDRGSIVANDEEKKKEPTIDSVVQDVYQILRPTTSRFVDADAEPFEESKTAVGVPLEKMESVEEEDDENRFTRLGEKVTQVPRPSLSSYLRRAKVPPSTTLQQLANLYDSLSKDARKQGFGKYTGYSDEVLNTLETSAEGGIGPQLKQILAKMLERNELTREDAKTRTSQAVRDLDNPSSTLSKELRPLLPLRYSP